MWEDRVWDIEDPGNRCGPREAAHRTKTAGTPIQPAAPPVAHVLGTGCLCTSKQGRERASVCEYRRLQRAWLLTPRGAGARPGMYFQGSAGNMVFSL